MSKPIDEMTIEELRTRAAEIRTAVNEPDADLNALDTEATRISERIAAYEAEQRRREIANRVAGGEGTVIRTFLNGEPENRNADSVEYRNAFLKNLRGDEMTREERAAFTHTTQNTGMVMPTTMLNEIWDLVSEENPILNDVTIYRTGTILEVVKHTAIAAGDAKKVDENAANDDEQNTFVKVTLSGKDFSKHVEVSYALQTMSIDAFEQYLVREIGSRLGSAIADDIVAKIGTDMTSGNKIESAEAKKTSYAELASVFAKIKRAKNLVVYANRSTIYNYLVSLVDTTGRPIYQPNAQAGAEGVLIGAMVKVEDAIADNVLLIGDPKQFAFNMVQDIMIEHDRDIKRHVDVHSGYARGEGALLNPDAFAQLTVKQGE